MDEDENEVGYDINNDDFSRQVLEGAGKAAGSVIKNPFRRISNLLSGGKNKEPGDSDKKSKSDIKKTKDGQPNKTKIKIIIVLVIIAIIIIVGLFIILKIFIENNVAGMALDNLIQTKVEIACTSDGEYYYKLDHNVIDNFILELNKSYEDGGYNVGIDLTFNSESDDATYIKKSSKTNLEKMTENQIQDENTISMSTVDGVFNKSILSEWFQTEDIEQAKAYLVRMIRAEIESTCPRLSSYTGKIDTEDSQENRRDINGDYVAQGLITVKRTQLGFEDKVIQTRHTKSDRVVMTLNEFNKSIQYFELRPVEVKKGLPLVIWLHGDGGSGGINYGIGQYIIEGKAYEIGDFIFIAPQKKDAEFYDNGNDRKVIDLIWHVAEKYQCDTQRITIMGQSHGGIGTCCLLQKYNSMFAAGVPISANFQLHYWNVSKFSHAHIWGIAGYTGDDEKVCNDKMSDMVRQINDKFPQDPPMAYMSPGIETGKYTHGNITEYVYNNAARIIEWMLEQRLDEPPTKPKPGLPKDFIEGEPVEINYIPPETFKKCIDAGDYGVLNYYTLENGKLYYATYKYILQTENGEEVSLTGGLREHKISIRNVTKLGSMPFNFLFSLLQTSNNPEYVMAVARLLEDTELVLMLQDQLYVNTETQELYPVVKKQEFVQVLKETDEDKYTWVSTGRDSVSYYIDTSGDKTEIINYTVSDSVKAFVQKANTWCLNFEQQANPEYKKTNEEPEQVKYTSDELVSQGISGASSEARGFNQVYTNINDRPAAIKKNLNKSFTIVFKSNSINKVLYQTSTETINIIYSLSVKEEKKINHDNFLGLWKNKTGKYDKKQKSTYDANGREVGYELPPDYRNISYPAQTIVQTELGEDLDLLIELLSRHQDTQLHEQLMMYFWSIYSGDNKYQLKIDKIADLFNTNIKLTRIQGTALENYIKAWTSNTLYKYETGQSPVFPVERMSDDEQYYIVYEDGSAGHNNVPYGLTTFCEGTNGDKTINHPIYGMGYYNNEREFEDEGIDVSTLHEGDLVPIDIAKNVFSVVVKKHRTNTEEFLEANGIELENYQIDALAAIRYQYGNLDEFPGIFKRCLKEDGEIDYDKLADSYSPLGHGTNRTESNMELFRDGIYRDKVGMEIEASTSAQLIMDACEYLTEELMNHPRGYFYPQTEDGEWDRLNWGGVSAFHPFTPNGHNYVCCADFVAMVLYQAELFSEGEINSYHYHSTAGIEALLFNAGWEEYEYEEALPGDIASSGDHAFIMWENDTIWDECIGQYPLSRRTDKGYRANGPYKADQMPRAKYYRAP